MAIWSRLKSIAGGHYPLSTLASAATLNLPSDDNAFYVSGTTTITSLLNADNVIRNRSVMFIGAASAVVTFTNTNSPTTAGEMYLHGANRTIQEDDVIELICKSDGTWILRNLVN